MRGYRRYAAYPAATWAGVFTNIAFGFLRGYILLALFRERDVIGGYTATDTITYVWLTQALLATVFIGPWHDLALRIRSGDVATDLLRPVDQQLAGLAADVGRAAYHLVFRGLPPLLVGALAFDLTSPGDALAWLAVLVSVVLAVAVSYAFRFLYNVAAFWLLDYRGVTTIAMVACSLLSGFIVPVPFFPDWLGAVAAATPFPAMLQVPIDIFVGRSDGADAAVALAVQAGWLAALLLAGRAAYAAGTRRLVVQGG